MPAPIGTGLQCQHYGRLETLQRRGVSFSADWSLRGEGGELWGGRVAQAWEAVEVAADSPTLSYAPSQARKPNASLLSSASTQTWLPVRVDPLGLLEVDMG